MLFNLNLHPLQTDQAFVKRLTRRWCTHSESRRFLIRVHAATFDSLCKARVLTLYQDGELLSGQWYLGNDVIVFLTAQPGLVSIITHAGQSVAKALVQEEEQCYINPVTSSHGQHQIPSLLPLTAMTSSTQAVASTSTLNASTAAPSSSLVNDKSVTPPQTQMRTKKSKGLFQRRMNNWPIMFMNSAANAARKCTRVVTKRKSAPKSTPTPQPHTEATVKLLEFMRKERRLQKLAEYVVPQQDIIVMSMHGMELQRPP